MRPTTTLIMTDMYVTITATNKYRALTGRYEQKVTLPCATCEMVVQGKCNESITDACILRQLFPLELYTFTMDEAEEQKSRA